MSKSFGSANLKKCVEHLGFAFHSSNSSHLKYYPPKGKDAPAGVRPFFTFQLGRRVYDPYSANRYISQLKKFGFTKKEIEENL